MEPAQRSTWLPLWLICWCLLSRVWTADALATGGYTRLFGPVSSCLVTGSTVFPQFGNETGTATSGSSDGAFTLTTQPQTAGSLPDTTWGRTLQLSLGPASPTDATSCIDTFTLLPLPYATSPVFAPLDATAAVLGPASAAVGAFMALGPHSPWDPSTGNVVSPADESLNIMRALLNATAVADATEALYGGLAVPLARFGLGGAAALTLHPLSLMRGPKATDPKLATALYAADAQVGAVVSLGSQLLAQAAAGAGVALSRPRAAELVGAQLLHAVTHLDEYQQALLASSPPPPSPSVAVDAGASPPPPDAAQAAAAASSPPPPGSAQSIIGQGVYGSAAQSGLVRLLLLRAAQRVSVILPPGALYSVAEVAAGLCHYLEDIKQVALLELLGGSSVGLNPLNALISMARLQVVQADAAAQVPDLFGANPAALDTYVLDALPERVSKALVGVDAIHVALGLTPPARAVPAIGVAHVVGPLVGCTGQANDLWDPAYESLTTGGNGRFTLGVKGLGTVAVSPYRPGCTDLLTLLPLNLSISALGPAQDQVGVAPLAMLAQAFYTVQANSAPTTVTSAQVDAAYAALGLSYADYRTAMFAGVPAAPVASPSPPPPPPSPPPDNSTAPPPSGAAVAPAPTPGAPVPIDLGTPMFGAVLTANAQMVGLLYSSRALYTRSCLYAYGISSAEQAHIFTAQLAVYAAALQANAAGGKLALYSQPVLTSVFALLAKACSFNTSALQEDVRQASYAAAHGLTNYTGLAQDALANSTLLAGGPAVVAGSARRLAAALSPADVSTSSMLSLAGQPDQQQQLQQSLEEVQQHQGECGAPACSGAVASAQGPGQLGSAGAAGVGGGPGPVPPQHPVDGRYEDRGSGAAEAAWQQREQEQQQQQLDLRPLLAEAQARIHAAHEDQAAAAPALPSSQERQWQQQARSVGAAGSLWRLLRPQPEPQPQGRTQLGPQRAAQRRELAVYASDRDMPSVYTKVAEVLAGANTQLQVLLLRAQAAAAAGWVPGSAAANVSGTPYNHSEVLVNGTQLAYVLQSTLYNRLDAVLNATYIDGVSLVVAMQQVAADFAVGPALQARMAAAPIAYDTICANTTQCNTTPVSPSPPPPGGGDSSSSSSNVGLYVAIGVGAGVLAVVGVLVAWYFWRRAKAAQVKRTVVDNFKTGHVEMTNLNMRMSSTMPGVQRNGTMPAPGAGPAYVPAALAHNPSMAQHYPIHPGMATMMHPGLGATMPLPHSHTMAGAAGGYGGNAALMASYKQVYSNGVYKLDLAGAGTDATAVRDADGIRTTASMSHAPLSQEAMMASLGGRRGSLLPPLAGYSAVHANGTPSAPMSPAHAHAGAGGLGGTIRTIPINTSFNTSLRPQPHGAAGMGASPGGGLNSSLRPPPTLAQASSHVPATSFNAHAGTHGSSTPQHYSGPNSFATGSPPQGTPQHATSTAAGHSGAASQRLSGDLNRSLRSVVDGYATPTRSTAAPAAAGQPPLPPGAAGGGAPAASGAATGRSQPPSLNSSGYGGSRLANSSGPGTAGH